MEEKKELLLAASILKRLINKRVKAAKRSHDYIIVENYCEGSQTEKTHLNGFIYQIMPPRRSWVKLSQHARFCQNYQTTNQINIPIDSLEKNRKRLELTIKRDQKKTELPPYLVNLHNYIYDIQTKAQECDLKIASPSIIPKKKNNDPNSADKSLRPLCIYDLDDNIILQEVNSYLTKKFDCLFHNCSYAFRANKAGKVPTHHDTINKISEYLDNYKTSQIFVAECDLRKFFDTINHRVVLDCFYKCINDNRVQIPSTERKLVVHIFREYLLSYTFTSCVKKAENTSGYLEKFNCTGFVFKWLSEYDLINTYSDPDKERIGIPQGGALSGLIANIVLNEIDGVLSYLNDPNLLYLRYCDDMIMLHIDKEKLQTAFELYQTEAKKKKLFIHPPKNISKYDSSFYDSKSRNPYPIGPLSEGKIPWISFVGYQIGYQGEIRVRKSSLEKEMEKQIKIVNKAISEIEKNDGPRNPKIVVQSLQHRLQGMSVGHINIYALDFSDQTLCWTNGFKKLTNNPFSRSQMRRLDKSRRLAMHKIYKSMEKWKTKDEKEKSELTHHKHQPVLYYGKPYSYYYWISKCTGGDKLIDGKKESNN